MAAQDLVNVVVARVVRLVNAGFRRVDGRARSHHAPGTTSPFRIGPSGPDVEASERLDVEIRGRGTIAGAAISFALSAPSGYYNEPTEVIVIDRATSDAVVSHPYPGEPGATSARVKLGEIQHDLATMTLGEFCQTYGIRTE